MRVRLTLAQLQAFVQVADGRSFRAAAQLLHVSQPALSRTIRLAEQAVGARLFDRDTRHVDLTPAGLELLPIARRILDEFDGAFSELAQFLEGRSGHVTVVALPSIGVALLPQAIAAFRARHPQVEFTLMEAPAGPLLTRVIEGRADFGVSVRPAPDQRLHYRHLLDDPFALVCRRDDELARRTAVNWSVFETRPFLASEPGSSIRPVTDAALLHNRISLRPAFTYPSVAAAGALVAAGLGLTALPRLALPLAHSEALAVVKLQRPSMSRPLGIVTRAGRSLSPVSRAFIEALCGSVAGQTAAAAAIA
jgi:DNA-binding transcriptional LysR family regulator